MTFKELHEISSEIHFDLFDEVSGSLGCLSHRPHRSMIGYLKWWKMPLCRKLVCVSPHMLIVFLEV